MSIHDDGHIIAIIPAAPGIWLRTDYPPSAKFTDGKGGPEFSHHHHQVAYFALVEGETDLADEYDGKEPDRWVEARSATDEDLDNMNYACASGPCDRTRPGEWMCEGHFRDETEATME